MKKFTPLSRAITVAGLITALVLVTSVAAMAQTGVLFVTGGNVGIGTSTPSELLHLQLAAGLELKMRIEQSASNAWAYSVVNSGPKPNAFRISKQGSGGPEMELVSRFDAGGIPTMEVFGSIKATNVVFSSSRKLKTDIASLNGAQVLERVADLPLATWRLKTEDASARHYGPMAEDFQQAFDLQGDGTTISMVDANGIAFAAIQGLYEEVKKRDETIEALAGQVAELQVLVNSMSQP